MNGYPNNNDADKRARRPSKKKVFRRTIVDLGMVAALVIGSESTYLISSYDQGEHDKQLRAVVEIVERAPRSTIALEPGELKSEEGYTKVIGPEIQPLVKAFPRVNEKEIARIFRNNIMYKGLQDLPRELTGIEGKVRVWSAPDINKNGYVGMIKPLDIISKEYQ